MSSNNDNSKKSPASATANGSILGVLSALLVPIVLLAAIGLFCGLMWNNVMPKLGWPTLSSLEALSLWYMFLFLVCVPFTVCVGIWKAMTPPVVPQIYITTQAPDEGPSTERIMSNLTDAMRSVAPPPVREDNHPNLIDPTADGKKKDDHDDPDDDDDDDDFTIPTA